MYELTCYELGRKVVFTFDTLPEAVDAFNLMDDICWVELIRHRDATKIIDVVQNDAQWLWVNPAYRCDALDELITSREQDGYNYDWVGYR